MTSSPEQTTLGRSVGSDAFVHQIAAHARKQAELAEQASGGEAAGHVAALHNVADLLTLTARVPRDQRIFALWKIAMYTPDSDAYLRGENQASLFGKLGTGVAAPLPESTLNELVAAAVDDLLEGKSAEDETPGLSHAVASLPTPPLIDVSPPTRPLSFSQERTGCSGYMA